MGDPWKSTIGKRLRGQVFRRDRKRNAPCWLCGGPIDYSLGLSKRSGTPDAYEPDHIKPRDLFPDLALDPANIAAAHSRCNRARGKKAALNELGKRTRNWGE